MSCSQGLPRRTHLSSNLNFLNPTIAVPFAVVTNLAYPKELRTLSDHLRKKRLDLGLLQRDVARILSVDEDSVCHWEVGHSHPKPYLIPRVIEFLGYAPWTAPAWLGEWLVMARRANGLSRKRFAKRLGVGESTVFRWESERGHTGSRLLARLRTRFSVEEIRVVLQARSQREFSG
jgi:DNA-binding transcriptional regulator YiaG